MLLSARSISQVRITGVVLDKRSHAPVAFATIREEGTTTGTITNGNGSFVLTVTKANAVLDIWAIGYKTEKYQVTGDSTIVVKLKINCTRCFFDAQQIKAGLSSGVIHTPAGCLLNFTFPSLKHNVTLSSGLIYQTNFSGNHFIRGKLELRHLKKSCNFDFDIHASVTSIELQHQLNATDRNLYADFNFDEVFKGARYIRLRAGYATLSIATVPEYKHMHLSAPILGVTAWIGRRTNLLLSSDISFYKKNPLVTLEISRQFKKLGTFIRFYKLDAFTELSIGAVKTFYYYLKKNKRSALLNKRLRN